MSLELQGQPVKDNGPLWSPTQTYTTSADLSAAPASISAAPATGERVVVDDLLVSVGAAMAVTLTEETTGTVLAVLRFAAAGSIHFAMRNGLRVPTADKRLQTQTSGAGAIDVTVSQHSEGG